MLIVANDISGNNINKPVKINKLNSKKRPIRIRARGRFLIHLNQNNWVTNAKTKTVPINGVYISNGALSPLAIIII